MKQCPKCQANISDTAKFCVECGCNIKKYEEEHAEPKARFCPECGTEISKGAFCPECGYNISGDLNNKSASSAADIFGDDWLSDLESRTNEDVTTMQAQKSKENMEKALAAFEYETHSDGTYTITGLKDKNLLKAIIPEGAEAIGDNAFEGSEIISVSLPEGLLKIGNRSFAKCAFLNRITLPDSLMFVGDEAFADCEMLDINLPTSICKLGKDAIKNTATDNKRIQAEADEAKRLDEEKRQKAAEDEKKKLDEERKKAEEALKKAKNDAKAELNAYVDKTKYRKAQVDEIDKILKDMLPVIDNTTVLAKIKNFIKDGKKALDKVKTDAAMTAEEKQKELEAEARRKAKEEAAKEAEKARKKAEKEKARKEKEEQARIAEESRKQEEARRAYEEMMRKFDIKAGVLVKYKGDETDVIIPTNVSIIGESAFENNTTVRSVQIPDGVREIRYAAFYGCSSLRRINLPNGLQVIADYAFAGTNIFGPLRIPYSVKEIGKGAFINCDNLKKRDIYVPRSTKFGKTGLFSMLADENSFDLECYIKKY